MTYTRRDECRPIIAQVIRDHPDATEAELRLHIRRAYPFQGWYRAQSRPWLQEVRRQVRQRFGD